MPPRPEFNRYLTESQLYNEFRPLLETNKDVDPAIQGPYVVLFTRPDLNLSEPTARSYLGVGGPSAPENLVIPNLESGFTQRGFIPLLTNSVMSAPHQDIVLDTGNIGENWQGAMWTTAKDTINSIQSGSVSINFMEWAGSPISKLFRVWVEYISAVVRGRLTPKKQYIERKIIDFHTSIYSLQLAPDGRTVLWASKFTGAFPTGVPSSAFEGSKGNTNLINLSIPFSFQYYEAMDPNIFTDINHSSNNITISSYNSGENNQFELGNSGLGSRDAALPGGEVQNGRKPYCIISNADSGIVNRQYQIFFDEPVDIPYEPNLPQQTSEL